MPTAARMGRRVMDEIRGEDETPAAAPEAAAPEPGTTGGPDEFGWNPDALPVAPPGVEHYARHLGETSASLFMFATLGGVFARVEPAAFKLFRDKLLLAAGNPSDPLEVMLIEQAALAHMNVGRLHLKSATASDLEEARA